MTSRNTQTTMDSNNHADTFCFGPNFVMDSYIGQVCDVSGLNNNVTETGVQVGTGLTVYDDKVTRKLKMFEVQQGLDLRHCLDHTLANPNQARVFGIDWCNNPINPYQHFGITMGDRFFPFEL